VPTYQYACTACEERLEVVQSFTDDALTTCPACGGRLRKVFSAAGIIFKGSGFYRTDSRSKSTSNGSGKKAESEGSESKSSADAKGKESKGSDSKSSDSKSSSSDAKSGSSSTSTSSPKVA
jgi:putative FmdB family regulatory protein